MNTAWSIWPSLPLAASSNSRSNFYGPLLHTGTLILQLFLPNLVQALFLDEHRYVILNQPSMQLKAVFLSFLKAFPLRSGLTLGVV